MVNLSIVPAGDLWMCRAEAQHPKTNVDEEWDLGETQEIALPQCKWCGSYNVYKASQPFVTLHGNCSHGCWDCGKVFPA